MVTLVEWIGAVGLFVLQLLQSVLVWPTAVLVLGWLFLRHHRPEIDGLLRRIRRIGRGETGIDFHANPPPQNVVPTPIDPLVAEVEKDVRGAAAMLIRFRSVYRSARFDASVPRNPRRLHLPPYHSDQVVVQDHVEFRLVLVARVV